MDFPIENKNEWRRPTHDQPSSQLARPAENGIYDARAGRAARYFEIFSERVTDYAFITFDAAGCVASWSRGAEHILQYPPAEILGQPGSVIFTPEDRASGQDELELAIARRDGCAEDERWHIRRDGSRFWASGTMTAHRDPDGKLEGYSKVLRDLTSRKLMEEELRESQERFSLFAHNVTDYALVPVDLKGNVSGWNSGAGNIFGYTEEEIVGQPVSLFFVEEDRDRGESDKDLARALDQGRSEDERWMTRRDGSRFWARWVTTPIRGETGELRGFAKVLRDETTRKELEDALTASLREKDVLLREIHHRVKNNLQVISSILALYSDDAADARIKTILDDVEGRVRAIAALHETLYSSRDLANIDFGPYMRQLLADLNGCYRLDPDQFRMSIECDDIVLPVEQALPLGLIVNELVSNALKHAFDGKAGGHIEIEFRYLAADLKPGDTLDQASCRLSVCDDGTGIQNPDEIWSKKSMGLRMVRLLTAQLKGEVHLDQSEGTCFSVQFPLAG